MIEKTAILGTGGWGTALAVQWAREADGIVLWGHTPERVEEIARTRLSGDIVQTCGGSFTERKSGSERDD